MTTAVRRPNNNNTIDANSGQYTKQQRLAPSVRTPHQFLMATPANSRASAFYVVKRDGSSEKVSFDKIALRLEVLCEMEPALQIDVTELTQSVIAGLYNGVHTTQLDRLAAETASAKGSLDPAFFQLASRIAVSDMQKTTPAKFSDAIALLRTYVNRKTGLHSPLISDTVAKVAADHADKIDAYIKHERDYRYSYFGLRTLQRSYLLQIDGAVVERPQYLIMRVALCLHGEDLDAAFETYDLLSQGFFTHATPTLFNAGTPNPQMSSCFLLTMKEDSIEGIYETLKQCALVSKSAGGIGLAAHKIRASNSYIRGTNGTSNGLVPMIRVFNDTARYVDQGGGKRKGAFAIYLEPWHADVFDFLDLKKNNGKEEQRARDLFYALWIPDLFMKRVEQGGDWSLFCPNEAPGLFDSWGKEFEEKYERYEKEGRARRVVKAQELWFAILTSQIETGTPYMLYKDACLTGDSEIATKDGLRRIDECDGLDVIVPFKSDDDQTHAPHYEKARLIKKGVKPVLEITVKGGGTIKATEDHKFLTTGPRYNRNTPYAWKTAKELQIGDRISAPATPAVSAEFERNVANYDDDFAVAGWILGDGWIRDKAIGACFGPTDTFAQRVVIGKLDSWSEASAKLSGHAYTGNATQTDPRTKVVSWTCSKKLFVDRVKGMFGFKSALAREKRIPDKIKRGTALEIASCLSGLFSSDGCATYSTKGTITVSLSSASKGLLVDAQLLLKLFGIHGRVSFKEAETAKDRAIGDLSIQGRDNVRKFVERVGFGLCPRKQEKAEEGLRRPNSTVRQRDLIDHMKIESIVAAGDEEVFDLSLESGHHFLANGMTVHNCNGKSNQQHLGTIQSSNLCTEIVQYTSPDEVAVCNLASIALPMFVSADGLAFDFKALHRVVKTVTRNLNKVIDLNHYPLPEARNSNMRHRPIGIGVQGLADVFMLMGHAWESEKARELNRLIFETIYHAALEASCEIARRDGVYSTYEGSPVSKGRLQPDMWGVVPTDLWDWAKLRADVAEHGVRNSLLVSPMPTASTSQILGNNECFEPYTSNVFSRSTLAGEFMVVNNHLVRELTRLGLWSREMKDRIVSENGSVQAISEIPANVKALFKTAWEIPQRVIIDMAADRGAFIDQSQSLNLYMADPTFAKLTSMHFYAWRKGLKTGMYYLRSRAKAQADKFTLQQTSSATPPAPKEVEAVEDDDDVCYIGKPGCDSCGS